MALENMIHSQAKLRRWPRHGWLGLVLIGIAWPLNWLLPGLRTHWGFFPLWLGYCLTVDALVFRRKGHSLLSRNSWAYLSLFLISAPAWWLFELINWRTQNWFYDGREFFSNLEYAALATLSFSTVMPAVFGTAELASTFRWLGRLPRGPLLKPTQATTRGFFTAGWLMLASLLLWPRLFFPLIWLSLYFIVAPINIWRGHRSLSKYTAVGDWRPVVALWAAGLICGFFWELWNFYAYPKWIYQVPTFDFMHIFEMPLLGYGGYLPFTLELFALYHLITGFLGGRNLKSPIEITPAADGGSNPSES